MIIQHFFRFPTFFELSELNFLFSFILIVIFCYYFLLTVWNYFFTIVDHCIIIGSNIFLQTIKETSFPNIDNFIRSSRNEVIPVSAKLSCIWMRLESILEPAFLRIPYFGCSVVGGTD
jgi:hypothetical protein